MSLDSDQMEFRIQWMYIVVQMQRRRLGDISQRFSRLVKE
jgi:hypothetical protein